MSREKIDSKFQVGVSASSENTKMTNLYLLLPKPLIVQKRRFAGS